MSDVCRCGRPHRTVCVHSVWRTVGTVALVVGLVCTWAFETSLSLGIAVLAVQRLV